MAPGMAQRGIDLTALKSPLMVFSAAGAFFDWAAIKACAAEAKPPAPMHLDGMGMFSDAWREFDHRCRLIDHCRMALAARHEGWQAASRGATNEYQPEPMLRDDDLRHE